MHYNEVRTWLNRGQRRRTVTVALLVVVAAPAAAQSARDSEPWRIVQQPQSSQVLARDGSLLAEVGSQIRMSVSIRSLPRYLPQAFIAVEDQRF